MDINSAISNSADQLEELPQRFLIVVRIYRCTGNICSSVLIGFDCLG